MYLNYSHPPLLDFFDSIQTFERKLQSELCVFYEKLGSHIATSAVEILRIAFKHNHDADDIEKMDLFIKKIMQRIKYFESSNMDMNFTDSTFFITVADVIIYARMDNLRNELFQTKQIAHLTVYQGGK